MAATRVSRLSSLHHQTQGVVKPNPQFLVFTINFILWLLGLGVVAVSLWLLFDEHLYLQVRANFRPNYWEFFLVGKKEYSNGIYCDDLVKKISNLQTMSDQRTDYYLGTYIILGIGSLVIFPT